MKDNGAMTKPTVRGNSFMQMVTSTRESGSMTKQMVAALTLMRMGLIMRATGLMISSTDPGLNHGQTEHAMKESISKAKRRARAN